MKDFIELPHTADIKIQVFGTSLQDLFAHAVVAMFQVVRPIAPNCTQVNDRLVCKELPQKRELVVTSIDKEALLVDFLSEALYLSDIHNEAYLKCQIAEFSQTHVSAVMYGVKITGYEVVEIKAVTYHDLVIQEKDGEWSATIVFDI